MESLEDKHPLFLIPLLNQVLKAREENTKPNVPNVAGNIDVVFAVLT